MNCWPIALLVLSLCGAAAQAWDNGGHEIIATIAYAHLNAKARAAVDRLAPQLARPAHPYDAITLACWMDDIRHDQSLADYGKLKSWHYIDIPLDSRDPTPSFDPGTDNDVHGNAVQALKRAMVVLQGGTDPYITSQPMALAIVEHLVGDIHQPLHCATKYFLSRGERRDDKGGNDEYVLNGPPGDAKFNLHAFWDSAWRASFDDATGNVTLDDRLNQTTWLDPSMVRDLATAIDRENNKPPGYSALVTDEATKFAGLADFNLWAGNSNRIARDFVYPGITATDSLKYCRLNSKYVSQSRGIARGGLDLAGLRLAALLNATLGAEKPPPVPPSYPAGPPAQSY
jgi:hypothetical protein